MALTFDRFHFIAIVRDGGGCLAISEISVAQAKMA